MRIFFTDPAMLDLQGLLSKREHLSIAANCVVIFDEWFRQSCALLPIEAWDLKIGVRDLSKRQKYGQMTKVVVVVDFKRHFRQPEQ